MRRHEDETTPARIPDDVNDLIKSVRLEPTTIEAVIVVYGISYDTMIVSRSAALQIAEQAKGKPVANRPGWVIASTRIEGDEHSGQVIAIAERRSGLHILVQCIFCPGMFRLQADDYRCERRYKLKGNVNCPHCKTRIVAGKELEVILTSENYVNEGMDDAGK